MCSWNNETNRLMVNFYIFCPCSVQWTNLHSQFKLRIFCPDTKYLWKYIKTLIFFFFIVQNHLVGNFSSSFNFVLKILKQTQKRYDNWIFLGKTVNQPVFLTKKKNASEVLYFVFSCLLFWCCWNCFSAIYMFDQIWII